MAEAEPGALPTAVLNGLADGSCQTIDYLADALGLSRRQVSDGAAKLVLRGLLERIEAGCYQLTEAGHAAAKAGMVIKSGPWRGLTGVRKPVAGTFRQRLWTAMRMSGVFTLGDVAMAAAGKDKNPENNAARYVLLLKKAGYVMELPTRKSGTRLTSPGYKRYRLIRDTGMRAPVYRPTLQSFRDYNTGEDVPCNKQD